MHAKYIHRCGAIILILFVLTHLAVHLTATLSPHAHTFSLSLVQTAYRHPITEGALIAIILTQIISGASRLRFRGARGWARLQVISGGYLLLFLTLHTGAALYTRYLFGLETDFYWAAGSLHFEPIRYGFAVYYFTAILAVFTHLAAALHFGWDAAPRGLKLGLIGLGSMVALSILAAFSGQLYPIDIPPETAAYYEQNFGRLVKRP